MNIFFKIIFIILIGELLLWWFKDESFPDFNFKNWLKKNWFYFLFPIGCIIGWLLLLLN